MTMLAVRDPDLPADAIDPPSSRALWSTSSVSNRLPDDHHVLLIEHDDQTANAMVAALSTNGYQLVRCHTPRAALGNLNRVEIILLNLEMPELDGPGFLAELRLASPATPLLVYSRLQDVDSVVVALRCGADDYLVRPIRPPELLARMKAVSRRASACCPPEQVVRIGDIEVYLNARAATAGGSPVRLTPREFDVLWVLARNAPRPVRRHDIMIEVWGRATLSTSRTLDVHMTALRNKLDRPKQLRTVRGFGYRLG